MHAIASSEGLHLVAIFGRLDELALAGIGVELHLLELELGEDHVEAVCRAVQVEAQVAIVASEVDDIAQEFRSGGSRQLVVVSGELLDFGPVFTVGRGQQCQRQWPVDSGVARGVAEADASQLLGQCDVEIGMRIDDGFLFCGVCHVPRRVPDGADVAVDHLLEALSCLSGQVRGERCGCQCHGCLGVLPDGIAPNLVFDFRLREHTLVGLGHGVIDVVGIAAARHFGFLAFAAYIDVGRLVGKLNRGREPFSDGCHFGCDDAVADDVGIDVVIDLVVVLVVQLQLRDAGETAAQLVARAHHHRIDAVFVVVERRVGNGLDAQLVVGVFPFGHHGFGEGVKSSLVVIDEYEFLAILGFCRCRPQTQTAQGYQGGHLDLYIHFLHTLLG